MAGAGTRAKLRGSHLRSSPEYPSAKQAEARWVVWELEALGGPGLELGPAGGPGLDCGGRRQAPEQGPMRRRLQVVSRTEQDPLGEVVEIYSSEFQYHCKINI